MKIPIVKRDGRLYLPLPEDFSNNEELELFKLKDGFYLISLPIDNFVHSNEKEIHTSQTNSKDISTSIEKESEGKALKINSVELSVLKKLFAIEFKNRTKDYVDNSLSSEEIKILNDLEKKNFINLFKGTKYKNGVYNINDRIYPLLNKQPDGQVKVTETVKPYDVSKNDSVPISATSNSDSNYSSTQKTPVVRSSQSFRPPTSYSTPVSAATFSPKSNVNLFELLQKQSYVVIADQNAAKDLSDRIKTDMKSGNVVGIRGFDGKFYVIKKEFYAKVLSQIQPKLTGLMSADELSKETSYSIDAINCVLHLLADSGEVIEKRKGYFEMA